MLKLRKQVDSLPKTVNSPNPFCLRTGFKIMVRTDEMPMRNTEDGLFSSPTDSVFISPIFDVDFVEL